MTISNDKLITLAKKYGTPLYVYDADFIIKKFQELTASFSYPKLKLHYAMKANYNVGILKVILSLGACIDAVSLGDVLLAKAVGFTPDKILFTANNITDEEMQAVKAEGVLFNIDSLSRLEKFCSAYPNSDVCIRFNPDVVAGAHENIRTGGALTKFGVLFEDLEKVKEIVASNNVRIVGIHKHTGSGVKVDEQDKFLTAIDNLCRIATVDNFPDLKFVDFGGGFHVPYKDTDGIVDYKSLGHEIDLMIQKLNSQFGSELEVYFEPGKFLVAEAGHLLIQVNTLKNNKGRLIAGTNSGFSQLIRPMFYQAYHQIDNLSNPKANAETYDICGNICETGDLFASNRPISQIREGDLLVIRNAGAYCYSMGSVYNLRPMPAEVIVQDDIEHLSRKRISEQELIDLVLAESNYE
ncbi:MAG: diaminopimelate decarboxylase [Bdellovibrionales bacterium]|nr:diaminopimelate decarboxylase [Bdellovibrionales bacterium]